AGNKTQSNGARSLVAEQRPSPSSPKYWSHSQYKGSDGKNITVHYCRTLKSTEEVARYFLDDKVVGLDLEWKAQASASDTIQNNMSLIQIANKERIALFHLALFQPAKSIDDLVAPSLRRIIQSPDITKVGVSIKADCTRLRKFLGINARGIFELSHLYKLVKYCHSNPALINKRLVNLSDQVLEHFGLPLQKDDDIRCGDWTYPLNYRQVQYAASDPYACLCLFYTMDTKRQALDPTPPLPAHAELDLPIRIVHETPVKTEPEDVEVIDPA
ncbi:ribonuclease H-like protein, partial [Aspergillus campestris IBT 28561]